jgi:hypothetical protein
VGGWGGAPKEKGAPPKWGVLRAASFGCREPRLMWGAAGTGETWLGFRVYLKP